MKTVIINRDFGTKNHTLGVCYVRNTIGNVIFKAESLERGWIDNKRNISCIPEGEYLLKLEWSPRFRKNLWEIYGVPNRRECKFHAANYWHQLNGCIALGQKRKRLDGDMELDVTNSKHTMDEFHKAMRGADTAKLIVKNVYL